MTSSIEIANEALSGLPHYITEGETKQLARDYLEAVGSIAELEQEVNEQARLNGMGASREAKLLTRITELEAINASHQELVHQLRTDLEAWMDKYDALYAEGVAQL